MKKRSLLAFMLILLIQTAKTQDVIIQVNAGEGRLPVSPYIYGRNNNFSDVFGTPTSVTEINLYKEAGLRFARENGGNNATKYNWRKKISSHPDWYNNVYSHDWDYASQTIQTNMPAMQTLWAFQLIGKVASNTNNNFNDWAYNRAQWWSGTAQNLAGGGQVNPAGGNKALVDGNPNLYLMSWPADSTVAILDHWFGTGGLGLNKNNFMYWSMDNEPEIWSGTHDDVMPTQLSASAFIDKYIEVAEKARQKFPEIKLTGPVTANEWQWYKWSNESININGKYYCWLEYFIKRIAEVQKATGIRLLDVLDLHWYPSTTADADVLQLYRTFYDKNYVYPDANGVKTINGGWDNTQTKEYIFRRANDWLNEYFGANNGITIGLSECAFNSSNPNITSVLYASILGTFADNGTGLFSPWTWKPGMWETLHLFSRYAKNIRVNTTSSLDTVVSGYSTINSNADSLTIIFVNRDLSASRNVTVDLSNFPVSDGSYSSLQLSSLPSTETFISHANNALKSNTVKVSGNAFTITLPSLSTTAVILKAVNTGIVQHSTIIDSEKTLRLYPNPANESFNIAFDTDKPIISNVNVYDCSGKPIDAYLSEFSGNTPVNINTGNYENGLYFIKITNNNFSKVCKLVLVR
jgi:hypothetical protein